VYLLVAVVLWWNAWSRGAATHTLCGCGDPALFLDFFQWPATAVAHGHNPFFTTALGYPGGVNLLAQTSVMGLSVPLIPVTWIFGPVASLNVASTLAPALSALAMFVLLRRWVRWAPAAFLGGLLYGFSPSELTSLQFAHLMTGAIMVLPLIVAVLDEILIRQQHGPRRAGALLGLLLFVQFFMSSELLAITVLLIVVTLGILVVAGWISDPAGLRARARHAGRALIVGAGLSVVLLAYPVWFALSGPGHLSGIIWPRIGSVGGYDGSNFVNPSIIPGEYIFNTLGGYQGQALPSSAYLGWGLLAVMAGGTVAWFRDRRLWLFGFLLALCVVCSFGERPGEWEPVRVFGHIPIIKNVIEQRYMVFGFLAAAILLALVVDHVRESLPKLLQAREAAGRALGIGAALGTAAVALVPIGATFASTLPFTMGAVALPPWYAKVAPTLAPGQVLLAYPAPFSGIQVSMAWQAVDAMHFTQVGVGGPQGVRSRAGSARPGFIALSNLAFGITAPQPTGTPSELAAVRHALAVWGVTIVVVAPQHTRQILEQGHDPTYAAAFMTAVLGRSPRIQDGAWVWDHVALGRAASASPALTISRSTLGTCVARDERHVAATTATLRVARCVEAAAKL
jgi:hypothetical protein